MKINLDRSKFKNNEEFFYHIYNDIGCTDLAIAYAEGDNWSKWFTYEELMSMDHDQKLIKCPTFGMVTPKAFMEIANNRTVLDIEIILDLDEPKEIKKYDKIIQWFETSDNYLVYAYRSGGKGIHIHIIYPELRFETPYYRRQLKKGVLEIFKADPAKAKRSMIALEGSLHRKTQQKKELIYKKE